MKQENIEKTIYKCFAYFWNTRMTKSHNLSRVSPIAARDVMRLIEQEENYANFKRRRKMNIASIFLCAYMLLPVGIFCCIFDKPMADAISIIWVVQSVFTGPPLVCKILGIKP